MAKILDGFFTRMRDWGLVSPEALPTPSIPDRTYNNDYISPSPPIVSYDRDESQPRQFDYTAGVNLNVIPRAEYQGKIPSFNELWSIYLATPHLRVGMDWLYQQVAAQEWDVQLREEELETPETHVRYSQLRNLVAHPDPGKQNLSFSKWLRSIIEEAIVTDANSIYVMRNKIGGVLGWMQLDGQTIKPYIDNFGRTPQGDAKAYDQYIKGVAKTGFKASQLVYHPFRPRPWCIYGESPVEAIYDTAKSYGLYQDFTDQYFTAGNLPEQIQILDPVASSSMSPAKYKEWNQQVNELSGQNNSRRRIHTAMPGTKEIVIAKPFTYDKTYSDWLIRPICVELGVPSYLFVSETNRATAKEVKDVTAEGGVTSLSNNIKDLIDELIIKSGFPEFEFVWHQPKDYRMEAVQGMAVLVDKGVLTSNEVREILGKEPVEESQQVRMEPGTAPVEPVTKSLVSSRKFAGKAALKRARAASALVGPIRKAQMRGLKAMDEYATTALKKKFGLPSNATENELRERLKARAEAAKIRQGLNKQTAETA